MSENILPATGFVPAESPAMADFEGPVHAVALPNWVLSMVPQRF
jgi:hypothetical protein